VRRSIPRGDGFAILSYLALSIVFLAPLSLDPVHRVAYIGDSISFIYFPIENATRLVLEPARLWQVPSAFPHESAALLESHRLGFGLIMAPLSALTGSPVFAANAATTLVYLANGMAARWMAACFGASPLGAWLSGALFAFHTYAVNEQPRPHVLFQAFLPVALVHLVRLLGGGGRRHAWWVAGMLVAQALFESYVAIFGLVVLTASYLLFLCARPIPTLRRTPALIVPAIASLLLVSPLVLAYVDMGRVYDYSREPPRSMDVSHYWATPETNLVYGAIGPKVSRQQMGPHFVGFVTLGLVVLSLATRRRSPSSPDGDLPPAPVWVPAAFLLMTLFVLLSLGRAVIVNGSTLGPGPFGFLYDHLALFRSTRIPERYSLLAMLFAAVLAGRALSVMAVPRSLGMALAFLALAEHLSVFPGYDVLPRFSDFPPVYRWLQQQPGIRAIAEIPIHGEGLVRYESLDMYYGMLHRKPVISGYFSFEPLLTRILRQVASDAPAADALQVLRRVGVDTLVVHEGRGGGGEMYRLTANAALAGRLDLLRQFEPHPGAFEAGRDSVYRIRPTPADAPPPLPRGQRVVDPSWRYAASGGNARLAGDSDERTQWVLEQPLSGGEFIRIVFSDRAVVVSGLVLPLTRKEVLPSDFAVDGRDDRGQWRELSRYRPAHRLQLVEGLLASPGRASVGFDLGSASLTGVRLRALPGARSFDGWRLSEIEIWTAPAQAGATAGNGSSNARPRTDGS
jgi:hypothetical protein